jgi:hypothetical protein
VVTTSSKALTSIMAPVNSVTPVLKSFGERFACTEASRRHYGIMGGDPNRYSTPTCSSNPTSMPNASPITAK